MDKVVIALLLAISAFGQSYNPPSGGGSSGAASVTNSDGTLTISPTTGNVVSSLNLANANTWTAAQSYTAQMIHSMAGAASTSPLYLTGAPYSAGNATTNFPLLYMNTSGANAVTTFSTSGTMLGINTLSSFSGYFIDVYKNATEVFHISNSGGVISSGGGSFGGTMTAASFTATGTLPSITNNTGTVAFANTSPNYGAVLQAGELVSSTSGTVNFTLTFGTAANHRWVCFFEDETTRADTIGSVQSTAPTQQNLTITGTTVSGDIISYFCWPH